MLIKTIKPDFLFSDERGTIVQLVHEGYKQVNTVFTRKGAVRGNMHYHAENNELFYIVSGSVRLSAKKDGLSEEHVFERGDMFLVEKGIRHSFEFLEDTQLIGLYDKGVESNGEKDIINDEEENILCPGRI